MRLTVLLSLLIMLYGQAWAIDQDQIYSVSLTQKGIVYSFSYARTKCVWDDLSQAMRDSIRKGYNYRNEGPLVFILAPDSVSQVALSQFLNLKGVAFSSELIALSETTKADILASGIVEKKRLILYISACVQIRADNPLWSDTTVRAVARGMAQ